MNRQQSIENIGRWEKRGVEVKLRKWVLNRERIGWFPADKGMLLAKRLQDAMVFDSEIEAARFSVKEQLENDSFPQMVEAAYVIRMLKPHSEFDRYWGGPGKGGALVSRANAWKTHDKKLAEVYCANFEDAALELVLWICR